MSSAALAWCLGACSLTALAVLAPAPDERDRSLARATGLYLEDAPARRPVAALTAELRRGASGRYVEVRCAATGEGVVAVPGIAGVPGANVRTADELWRLLDRGELRIVTRHRERSLIGDLVGVEAADLPQRRFASDGGLEAAPPAQREAAAVTFRSVPLPDGPSTTYLEVGGVPRLSIEVRSVDGTPCVRLESLGDPEAATSGGGQ